MKAIFELGDPLQVIDVVVRFVTVYVIYYSVLLRWGLGAKVFDN